MTLMLTLATVARVPAQAIFIDPGGLYIKSKNDFSPLWPA